MSLANHILGHDEAEKLLFSGNRNKSRSFLLEGQQGIGKSALAVKFAADILNCPLERITGRNHPDLYVLERRVDEKTGKQKKEISIEDARAMKDFLTRTPAEGTHRVVIVDSADELRMEAANCILKAVEEPPRHSVIILLSHGGFVLPTIRSRCTQIRLQPLPKTQMHKVIGNIMSNVHESDIEQLTMLAEGSPGTAKMIYENDGLWIIGELAEIFHNYPRSDYLQFSKFAERVAKNEKGWDVFCFILGWLLTSLAKASVRGEALEISGTQINMNIHVPLLLDAIDEWEEHQRNSDIYNLDHKQVIVNTLLKIAECWITQA